MRLGSWAGKDIFIEWSSRSSWVSSLVINGHPIGYNLYAHPYGLIVRVNVNPFIKPAEVNVIELWAYQTMTWLSDPRLNESDVQLDTIRIGWK